VMPYITNVEGLIEEIAPLVAHIYVYRLRMNAETDTNWQSVKRILSLNYPKLVEPYRRIAFSPDCPYWASVRSRLHEIAASYEGRLTIEV
jgi:hypothetical protein